MTIDNVDSIYDVILFTNKAYDLDEILQSPFPVKDGSIIIPLLNGYAHMEQLSKKFINALRHYHRKYKEKDRMYSAKPNHDWSSHFNDALRVLATGMERSNLQNKQLFQKDYKYEFSI